MPFFLRGKKTSVVKKNKKNTKLVKSKVKNIENDLPISKRPRIEDDEEITSDEDEEFIKKIKERQHESSVKINGFSEETADEKKERLAKEYIEEIRKNHQEKEDDEIHNEVSRKLKLDVIEASGRLLKYVTADLEVNDIKVLRSKHHQGPLTCLVVSNDEKFIFSSSKDSTIVKWTIDGEKKGFIPRLPKNAPPDQQGHATDILSLAISSDGKFLASGDTKGVINIWDPQSLKHLKTFTKHRKGKAISGLVFRHEAHTLYSTSHDRMVMIWNLDAMAYAESLGGHQDAITGIDALRRDACVTSGGRDGTVIVHVMEDDKQLRFATPVDQSSIDGIKLLKEKTFLTFAQNGAISLWTTLKKKPHYTVKAAHGNDESGVPNWIISLATLTNTDLIASGSNDGFIRLWKVVDQKKIEPIQCVAVSGCVNHLEFSSSGSKLVAAVGRENKLGRWVVDKTARNSLIIIDLKLSTNKS